MKPIGTASKEGKFTRLSAFSRNSVCLTQILSVSWIRSKMSSKKSKSVLKVVESRGHCIHQCIYPRLISVAECATSMWGLVGIGFDRRWDLVWREVTRHIILKVIFFSGSSFFPCFLATIDWILFFSVMSLWHPVAAFKSTKHGLKLQARINLSSFKLQPPGTWKSD